MKPEEIRAKDFQDREAIEVTLEYQEGRKKMMVYYFGVQEEFPNCGPQMLYTPHIWEDGTRTQNYCIDVDFIVDLRRLHI
jgi:hypothetical protein